MNYVAFVLIVVKLYELYGYAPYLTYIYTGFVYSMRGVRAMLRWYQTLAWYLNFCGDGKALESEWTMIGSGRDENIKNDISDVKQ